MESPRGTRTLRAPRTAARFGRFRVQEVQGSGGSGFGRFSQGFGTQGPGLPARLKAGVMVGDSVALL
jgi:hypothetical protein